MIIDTLNKDTHYFTLDLHDGAILSEPLNFKQYDERSRELAIELTVHDKPLDLSNARIDIWVYKKDGHTVMKPAEKENIDLDNSIVLIPLTRQMLILPPSVECEIVVTYADNRVLSFPIFEVTIERSNVDMDTVVSTSEFQLFYDALYRMEKWMRDYLKNYATIDQAFTTKLAALTLALQTVNAEWEQLKTTLSQDNQTNFNTFKQEQTAEMKKFYNQYHKFYTEQCVAIQEKLNTLQATIDSLQIEIEPILKASKDDSSVVKALKEQCQTLHAQITQIKTDADAKLAEMTRRFEEMNEEFRLAQEDRATKFTEAQEARKTAFDNAQREREQDFEKSQSDRTTAYTDAENARNSSYNKAEANRDASFVQAENTRQTAFEEMEVVRNNAETIRRVNENQRIANEDARVANEEARASNFNDMQEQFNMFISYRITE